jgi:signal transduction histidine kinase
MRVRAWLKPPRRALSLLIGVTVLLGATLAWLGWRLLEQDRALEAQQVRGRLEDAADRIAAALRQRLDASADSVDRFARLPDAAMRSSLTRGAEALAADAVLVLFTADAVEAFPAQRLPYRPLIRSGADDASAGTFARAESLEFRARDFPRAAAALQALARSGSRTISAGALLRLGRVLRKAGRLDSALVIYDALARESAATIEGLPADLLARYARLGVLEAAGRREQQHVEAESTYAELLHGHWVVTAGSFAFYADALRRLVPATRAAALDSMAVPALALAAAADSLWSTWRGVDPGSRFDGHRSVRVADHPVFLLWRGTGERAVAMLAGPAHLERLLLGGSSRPLAEDARIALADAEGRPLVRGPWDAGQPQALRTSAETGLPWTLRVAAADIGAARSQLAGRRRLVLLGLATAALIVVIGLYAVTRAVGREMEVARLKSDLVSAVSHEFRTPLTTIRQLTELLAGGRVASEERRATYYETLKRESERLHRLVEGLLDFGRMEAGALEFRFEQVEAAGLVREVVEEFRREVEVKGCQVSIIAMNGECPVRADREALGRAVWNLLDNAVKYSPDDRTVSVKVSASNGSVTIRVQDHGVGIPVEEQGRIFEKFVRGSGSGARAVKGTGIGLAMVRHIVIAHGGEVRVESAAGAGSTFTITLPAAS